MALSSSILGWRNDYDKHSSGEPKPKKEQSAPDWITGHLCATPCSATASSSDLPRCIGLE